MKSAARFEGVEIGFFLVYGDGDLRFSSDAPRGEPFQSKYFGPCHCGLCVASNWSLYNFIFSVRRL